MTSARVQRAEVIPSPASGGTRDLILSPAPSGTKDLVAEQSESGIFPGRAAPKDPFSRGAAGSCVR